MVIWVADLSLEIFLLRPYKCSKLITPIWNENNQFTYGKAFLILISSMYLIDFMKWVMIFFCRKIETMISHFFNP